MRSLLLVLSSIVGILGSFSPVEATEVVVAAGGPTRAGVPACPPDALLVGVDAASGRLLCNDGFVTPPNNNLWIVGEVADGPGRSVFSVWPPPPAPGVIDQRVAHAYAGSPMHSCAPGMFMTGFAAAPNVFLCARFASMANTLPNYLRRHFITHPTPRGGVPACPRGSALVGVHVANGTFLCTEFAPCNQPSHCPAGNVCERRSFALDPPDDPLFGGRVPGVCRPSGTLTLFEENGCRGNQVGWLTDRSANVVNLSAREGRTADSGPRALAGGYKNDKARSLQLSQVSAGAMIRVYDNSQGNLDDDFSEMLVRRATSAGHCINTFQFLDHNTLEDGFVSGVYTGFGADLDGKVSLVEVQTAILSNGGECLDVNQVDATVQLFRCHHGPNQRWTQGSNGTVQGINHWCLEAIPDDVLGWAPGGPRTARLQVSGCNGGPVQLWTRTPSQELRVFSDMCLDVGGVGTGDGTPVQVAPCNGSANQKWLATF
jgi:hypothetical protein